MAFVRIGGVGSGLDFSGIGGYRAITLTEQTPTRIVGDGRSVGQQNVVVEFGGVNLTGDIASGRGTGVLTQYSEKFNGTLVFEITGISIPWQSMISAITANDGDTAASLLLGSDDIIQGNPAGGNVLNGYGGRNVIIGGIEDDDLVFIDAQRAAAVTYRFGNEAVVFRTADRQTDLLSSIEYVSFRNSFDVQQEFAPAQPLQYTASYADLTARFGTDEVAAWRHFAQTGLVEGRTVSFSGLRYIASYADLRATFRTNAEAGAQHYLASGRAEGRTASFDGLRYIASNPDLIRVLPKTVDAGAMHFISFGANEGRSTTAFDPLRYIASHRDLIRAFGTNEARGTEHYLASGFTEGRSATAFNPNQYLANYADVRAAFGTDTRAATLHFIQYGTAENRVSTPLAGVA